MPTNSSMPARIKWKFVLPLLVGIAGVIVPLFIWRAEVSSRSVHVRVVSQTPLQPNGATVPGITILVDGQKLDSP